MTAAPAPAIRARASCPGAPAASGDDFAALLAGLSGAEAACTDAPPVEAALADSPPPEGTGCGQAGLEALVVPPPAPPAPAAPLAEAPAGQAAPAPAAQASSASDGPVPALPVRAGSAAGTAAAAGLTALVTPGLHRVADSVPPAPAGTPPVDVRAVSADAPEAPTVAPSDVRPVPAGSPTAPPASGAPALAEVDPTAAGGAPDAVVLSVPADVAGGDPVPVLDVRATVSPAAPATAAQTAGGAVPEAMLPTDSAAAPAAAAVVAGAEAGITGPQTADLRAGAPAAPAAPAPPPPPATQVVQLLTPVLTGPDGSYSLSLQLYPEELGAVQVEVLLRGGEIRLALHAPDEAAQAALRSALPDLRAELQAGGLSATSLSVDDGRHGQSSADRSPDRRNGQDDPPGRRPHPYGGADPAPRPPPSHSDAALDLRM